MENMLKTIDGMPATDSEQFLTLKEVMELCKISRGKIYSWMANGMFPPNHKTMTGTIWLKSDCITWKNSTPSYFEYSYKAKLKADYDNRNNQEYAA